ncbi:MAG: hypothetical protein II269_07640 [Bacteroidaceae bacterium]|nr:hypothetical protein [Bacteroidaceae bacterium]
MSKVNELVVWLKGLGFTQDGLFLVYKDELARYTIVPENDKIWLRVSISFRGKTFEKFCNLWWEQIEQHPIDNDPKDAVVFVLNDLFNLVMGDMLLEYKGNSILNVREGGR